jgi:hypothetical protein
MDRPAKRQRLLTPLDSVVTQTFTDRHKYYEIPNSELEEYDDDDEEEDNEDYGPDDFEQRRAQLDYKLKSTFEGIFEKYGQDFDGVADEIDLITGEIIVNNGHLVEMKNERDAGRAGRARPTQTVEEFVEDSNGSLIEEYSQDEDASEDEDDEDLSKEGDGYGDFEEDEIFSEDEMLEDDMILRGFAQASQFLQREPSQESRFYDESYSDQTEDVRQNHDPQVVRQNSGLPFRTERIAQFGPNNTGYLSRKHDIYDANVEPAWRVPDISHSVPKRRRMKAFMPQPEAERSPSPDNGESIWAPISYGKSTSKRKARKNFDIEDDEFLLGFVTKARKRGLDITSNLTWKQLAAMVIIPPTRCNSTD